MSLDGTQTLGGLLLSIPALCPVDAVPGSLNVSVYEEYEETNLLDMMKAPSE